MYIYNTGLLYRFLDQSKIAYEQGGKEKEDICGNTQQVTVSGVSE